jgi:hypothetical protein
LEKPKRTIQRALPLPPLPLLLSSSHGADPLLHLPVHDAQALLVQLGQQRHDIAVQAAFDESKGSKPGFHFYIGARVWCGTTVQKLSAIQSTETTELKG